YCRFCDQKKMKVEIMSRSEVTAGGAAGKSSTGFREILCQVRGAEAYGLLKWESGVHRVQRVPVTETQGRIHTSAATVAIMPVADEVEVDIQAQDLRVDVYRASGPGGQSVNTTDSAVRLTHIPTGITVQCQDEKSQHKNKAKALKVLAARILEVKTAEAQAEQAATRKAQVGSGDRSERIRTYNFPQNRITDHRAGLTIYQLDRIMEGELDNLLEQVSAFFVSQSMEQTDSL
ncbi:MAG: peptide chain release factor-like protein, partial [Myxococcota bacterium]|nr:peptide chain release factor-like protein [Myxococcota bacterium]